MNWLPRTDSERERISEVVALTRDFSQAEAFEANSGGAATSNITPKADVFSHPSANMSFERKLDFQLGDSLFRKLWVSSPSSTLASDGLGPLFNARSCQRCHINDGRGHPPEDHQDSNTSLLVKISVPGTPSGHTAEIEGYLHSQDDPFYGGQIQDKSLPGHPAEARIEITYTETTVSFADGETVSLRKPKIALKNLGYGMLYPELMTSARISPQMIGLGLLDAIPSEDILDWADPFDADGDGISGRANIVWSDHHEQPLLGRFGLKAGQPNILEQSAAAFHGDLGISTTLHPQGYGECTVMQAKCQNAPDGNTTVHNNAEIGNVGLDLVRFYASNLAVPARRNVDDPQVLRGKQVFYDTGCTSCHRPKFVTHRLKDQPEQSFQLIWPYTDMLLHDMGDGLADHRPEARATGREWRTPPLWGIGLTETVSGHTYFLHDGRARSLMEAVLWHGGEAQAARDHVLNLPKPDRTALIRFLESL